MVEYIPPHFYKRTNTARNILNFAERVQVIKDYESSGSPSFQTLSAKYDCSFIQIKNIIENRNAILNSYNSSELYKKQQNTTLDENIKREAKIVFMNKVMYEYLQRVVYYNYGIDDEKALQKADQIQASIGIENFQVDEHWIASFKVNHGIRKFDIATLREDVILGEAKKTHLGTDAMIDFVRRQELKARRAVRLSLGNTGRAKKAKRELDNQKMPFAVTHAKKTNTHNKNNDSTGSAVVNGNTFQDHIMQKLISPKPLPLTSTDMYSVNLQSQKLKRSVFALPDIKSDAEALNYLKVLEEYAMLHDNFRAIGLITRLEQLMTDKTKKNP